MKMSALGCASVAASMLPTCSTAATAALRSYCKGRWLKAC